MPEKKTIKRVQRARRQGRSAGTQAGEFVREEVEHIREGKHGARSAKQAIAIGLSKARRAGVRVPVPGKGTASKSTRKQAARDLKAGARKKRPSAKRSKASTRRLKREGRAAGSKRALSAQARSAARRRTAAQRSASARKAARTKGATARSAAARKGARTRARKRSAR